MRKRKVITIASPSKKLPEEKMKSLSEKLSKEIMDSFHRDKSKGSKLINSTMEEDTVLMGKAKLIDSSLHGFATVMDTALLNNTKVAFQGKVFGNSFAKDCYIGGNATVSGNANLLRVAMFNLTVVTDKATVINTVLSNQVIVMENAAVYNSIISGNVIIAGNCLVKNVELDGDIYINEGEWIGIKPCYCPPHTGLPYGITESINDRWTIGCTTFSYDFWMKKAHFVCKMLGLTPYQADKYRELLFWFRESVRLYRIQQRRDKEDAEK